MKRFWLVIGDLAILCLALFLTLWWRYGSNQDFGFYLQAHFVPFSIIFAFWLLVFYTADLYDVNLAKNNLRLFSTFFYSTAFIAFFSVALFYLLPIFKVTPKTNLLTFLVLQLILTTPWRYYFNRTIARSGIRNNT